VAQYPQVPEYQSSLGLALQNLAIQRFANDPVESRRLLEGAIAHQRLALGSNPRDQNARKFVIEAHADLETVLRKLGDHAGAAGAAEALVRLLPDDAGAIYRAARLLDLGATLAAADAKLPEAERIEVVRTRADLALKRLQQALKEGAVVKPSSLDAPAFEAIRKQSPAALERLKKDLEARARPAIG
jgi:tetratricopeptide (TPR) repeat protein